jgi:DNA (cytosine-5)-methyltransferase 1
LIQAVDLFCGAGGLTAGLMKAGLVVRAGFDFEPMCKFPYEENNGSRFVLKSVEDVTKEEILSCYSKGAVKLLAGCAPCQPFSTYNQGRDTRADRKWPLLDHFARLIEETAPDLVTMENVPDVTKHAVYDRFVETLRGKAHGYHVWAGTIRCSDYGLPQNRRRHVLLASKLGPIEFMKPTHSGKPVTVRDTLSALPAIEHGVENKRDPLHAASKLSAMNLARIQASIEGGTWRDWPEELVAPCHARDSGKTYPGVYGRMQWDAPSPTMTTLCYGFGNGRFGHPEQDRAISLREAAMLQAFPKKYKFQPKGQKLNRRAVGRLIGNAVPVRLGEVIGRSITKHVRKYAEDL